MGKTKFAIISGKTAKLAMENVRSLFLRVLVGTDTPFQAAQREHCPHPNHAAYLCRDHGL